MTGILVKKDGHWTNRLSEKPFDNKVGPRGSSWKLIYRKWIKEGSHVYEVFISNYVTGLTAYEAFLLAKWENCDPKPAFHEVAYEQLESFPRKIKK